MLSKLGQAWFSRIVVLRTTHQPHRKSMQGYNSLTTVPQQHFQLRLRRVAFPVSEEANLAGRAGHQRLAVSLLKTMLLDLGQSLP